MFVDESPSQTKQSEPTVKQRK